MIDCVWLTFLIKIQSMKRTFVKFTGKRFIPALIVAAFLLAGTPLTTKADPANNIEIVSNENTASVKFAGSTDNALLFELKVNNPKADKFTLVIRSEDGTVLYTKDYTDASLNKKIKILKTDDSNRYNISIRSSNKDLENNFSISATSRVVEDVQVTKL
jgi:hypothetical protein